LAGRSIAPFILNLALGGSEWSAWQSQQYFLQGKNPQHPSNRVGVGYSAGLDALEWRKIVCPCWEWNFSNHPIAL
jgi:hypothetical protein